MGSGAFGRNLLGGISGSQNEKWQEPLPTENSTLGSGAFGRDLLGGRFPVPKMKNGRNPYHKNTQWALGLLGGVYGGDLRFPK